MREFINMVESDDDSSSYEREEAVIKVVRHVFTKLGLEPLPTPGAVIYLEDMDRDCRVRLADSPISIAALAKLETLGLGRNFTIWGDNNGQLAVDFTVADGIENAEPV